MSSAATVKVSTVATIAATGSSPRDELLPSKGHTTISAITRFNVNFGMINEHKRRVNEQTKRKVKDAFARLFVCPLICSYDVDEVAFVAPLLKPDGPVELSEEGIISSATDV